MSEKYKNIDDLFRDNLQDLEVDPPAHVWNNVKAGIQLQVETKVCSLTECLPAYQLC